MAIITLPQSQMLRQEASRQISALMDVYQCQTRIVQAAMTSRTRWEREFAELQRIGRIISKALARYDRRSEIVHKFFI